MHYNRGSAKKMTWSQFSYKLSEYTVYPRIRVLVNKGSSWAYCTPEEKSRKSTPIGQFQLSCWTERLTRTIESSGRKDSRDLQVFPLRKIKIFVSNIRLRYVL